MLKLPAQEAQSTFSQFLGASVLSAIGSLPQHIGPLIIIAIVAEGRVSVVDAGWVLSARAFGDLLSSIALPAIGLLHLRRSVSLAASVSLLAALALATAMNFAAVVLGFFLVGVSCGVLKFLGTIAASTYRHRAFAFIFRLALVLGLSGITTCILLAIGAFTSYTTLLERLIVLLLPILVFGGLLYTPMDGRHSASTDQEQTVSIHGLCGLIILYLFFVGVSGFMAYAGQQASTKGMSIQDTVLSIGAMKVIAAVWLLIAAYLVPKKQGKEIVILELGALVVGIWIVFLSRTIVEFFIGFLLLEITLNGSSARLQSVIVGAAPRFSAQWLNAVILLGTATGPPLYGIAIGAGLEASFVVSSSVVVCLPLVWHRFAGVTVRR